MAGKRVRHHSGDEGLAGIQAALAIRLSRGWGTLPGGIHVEIQPFGPTLLYTREREGRATPKGDMGLPEDGAFVEFDVPPDFELRVYSCGPRNTALIVTDQPLQLGDLHPVFVKVRRRFWEFWRAPHEK